MYESYTSILNVKVSNLTYQKVSKVINRWIKKDEKVYVSIANVHLIMECQKDKRLLNGVNASGMVTPDGMPLVWLSRLYGKKGIERVYGPTLMLKLCRLAQKEGFKIYLLGGVKGLSGKLALKLTQRFAGIDIVGIRDTTVRPIPKKDNIKILKEINDSGADIVFVGMGCPYQEHWMIENRKKLDVDLLVGVGAAFDFITGRVEQAPYWMQGLGLEWIFRLLQDPGRLWRRYTLTNAEFIFKVLVQLGRDFVFERTRQFKFLQ